MFKTKINKQTFLLDSDVKFKRVSDFLGSNDTFDKEIDGIHYIVAYHAPSSSFIGIIENTLNRVVSKAQVEIHLSNDVELGPTKPAKLLPGEFKKIALLAHGQLFNSWNIVVSAY